MRGSSAERVGEMRGLDAAHTHVVHAIGVHSGETLVVNVKKVRLELSECFAYKYDSRINGASQERVGTRDYLLRGGAALLNAHLRSANKYIPDIYTTYTVWLINSGIVHASSKMMVPFPVSFHNLAATPCDKLR
jgi:hypothetical protein